MKNIRSINRKYEKITSVYHEQVKHLSLCAKTFKNVLTEIERNVDNVKYDEHKLSSRELNDKIESFKTVYTLLSSRKRDLDIKFDKDKINLFHEFKKYESKANIENTKKQSKLKSIVEDVNEIIKSNPKVYNSELLKVFKDMNNVNNKLCKDVKLQQKLKKELGTKKVYFRE